MGKGGSLGRRRDLKTKDREGSNSVTFLAIELQFILYFIVLGATGWVSVNLVTS